MLIISVLHSQCVQTVIECLLTDFFICSCSAVLGIKQWAENINIAGIYMVFTNKMKERTLGKEFRNIS